MREPYSPVYIERDADDKARRHLMRMEYITLIEPRQQGKTSLIHRLARALGPRYVFAYANAMRLDKSSEVSWYASLCRKLLCKVHFIPRTDRPSPPRNGSAWGDFMVCLAEQAEAAGYNLVIALDELGDVWMDWRIGFFSNIRAIFDERPNEPCFQHLTFILAGTYNPRALISDSRTSPFNVAQRVHLPDFTLAQTNQLVTHLGLPTEDAAAVAQRIHYWADGQPYLTQRLCRTLAEGEAPSTPEGVDLAVERLYREDANHLPRILEELDPEKHPRLREYVERVLAGHRPQFRPASESRYHGSLALIGVLKADEDGRCKVRNRIYEQLLRGTTEMLNEPSFTELHQAIIARYDLEELRTLSAQLGVPFDDLRGEGRSAKARELILWLRRRGRLDELTAALASQESTTAPGLEAMEEERRGSPLESRSFHDFELLIANRQRRGYPVRVIESPAGQAEGLFKMPWKRDNLERALMDMEEWETDETVLVDFGTRLFDALFTEDVRARYAESVGLAAGDAGLRIRLRLDPPELHELPWELLYDPEKREFLALSKRALITRYLHVPRPTPPLAVTPPLRLLVITATPSDWRPLSTEQEVQGIREALQPLVKEGLVQLLVEEHVTKRSLRKRLLDDAPHMLHYIGHGDFDGERGMLILEDGTQLSDPLDGWTLATLLKGTLVRLAVLNCCLGAKDVAADARQFGRKRAALLGVGPALVDAGLGAVVAMQFSADDEAAVVFARDFYEMVTRLKPIDEAVGRAREMVMLHSGAGNRNWATPVLFMRAPDGRLFDVAKAGKVGAKRGVGSKYEIHFEGPAKGVVIGDHTQVTQYFSASTAGEGEDGLNTAEERALLTQELAQHKRNLYKLRLRAAKYGIDVPISVLNQIEDEEQEIRRIEKELERLER